MVGRAGNLSRGAAVAGSGLPPSTPCPSLLLVPSTPRRKPPADAAARAWELAALGLPLASIAAALGVHRGTLHRWCAEAGPEGPERDLRDAIQEGPQQGEVALLQRLHKCATEGDARSATWLLVTWTPEISPG